MAPFMSAIRGQYRITPLRSPDPKTTPRPVPKASHPAARDEAIAFVHSDEQVRPVTKYKSPALCARPCGQYWIRTNDPFHVKEIL